MPGLLFDHRQDFVLAHDEVLGAVDLDLLARVLPEQNRVAALHVGELAAAVFLDLAQSDGEDLAALRLFFRAVGDDDAADRLFAVIQSLNDEAVVQWVSGSCDQSTQAQEPLQFRTGQTTGLSRRERQAEARAEYDRRRRVRCVEMSI
jgi:hypothetical protein